MRHNPAKLLLDPYARAIEGDVVWLPPVYAHRVDRSLEGDDELQSPDNSAAFVPRSVVVDDRFDWGDDALPRRPLSETLVYEAHVRNLTMRHPDVPEELRGTYAGLCHPSVLRHLEELGVTAVELLPVHAFTSEPELVRRGMRNHWGYNTMGFFAPHAAYAAASDPQGALDEFKGMVKLLHAEGIEVILDVVYNHTAEQSRRGGEPVVARAGQPGLLPARRPRPRRGRHRVRQHPGPAQRDGVPDGAGLPALLGPGVPRRRLPLRPRGGPRPGRTDDFDPDHPFLVALRTDPVLSRVKLIAEPWDVGLHGWRTGQFPPPFAEWNDRFRDTVRAFWLQDLAAARRTTRGTAYRSWPPASRAPRTCSAPATAGRWPR